VQQRQHAPLVGVAGTSGPAEHEQRTDQVVTLVPTLRELVSAYMAQYAGREKSRAHRLAWWKAKLGERPFAEITDDDVSHALEELAAQPARVYVGRDANGEKVLN
jgi:hypothetical protein